MDAQREESVNQKITPMFWFNDQAEAAANFYVSVFKNSEIVDIARYGEAGPGPEESVMVVAFRLDGQDFTALNGGPQFTFTEAVSFVIDCKSQEEVDYFWEKLTEGGEPGPCGWLKDKFGLSWQVVPSIAIEMMQDKDRAKANRVMEAIFQMSKIDIAKLKEAYDRA
jgi:predicted 3-demethylubiquinone-9 3-methyltransferase (glyoxalase superfamily)